MLTSSHFLTSHTFHHHSLRNLYTMLFHSVYNSLDCLLNNFWLKPTVWSFSPLHRPGLSRGTDATLHRQNQTLPTWSLHELFTVPPLVVVTGHFRPPLRLSYLQRCWALCTAHHSIPPQFDTEPLRMHTYIRFIQISSCAGVLKQSSTFGMGRIRTEMSSTDPARAFPFQAGVNSNECIWEQSTGTIPAPLHAQESPLKLGYSLSC